MTLQEQILASLADGPKANITIAAELGLERRITRSALQWLEQVGKVSRVRYSLWVLADSPQAGASPIVPCERCKASRGLTRGLCEPCYRLELTFGPAEVDVYWRLEKPREPMPEGPPTVVVDDGVEFEVLWSGKRSLLGTETPEHFGATLTSARCRVQV